MPIYNYKCFHCGNDFDKLLLSPKAYDAIVRCENCFNIADRKPSVAAFSVSGYSAKNGYSETKFD